MDLLSDIVEKDPYNDPQWKQEKPIPQTRNGFPELYKPEKISSWKLRLKKKRQKETQTQTQTQTKSQSQSQSQTNPNSKEELKPKTEAESIHLENLKTMNEMSEDEIINERKELLNSLDPKLIRNLLKNINKRQENETPLFAEIEGASGTWVGGFNENLKTLPSLSNDQINRSLNINENFESLKLDQEQDQEEGEGEEEEEEEGEGEGEGEGDYQHLDDDDIAPLDYQMAQTIDHSANEDLLKDVHFIRPESDSDNDDELPLDINDPNFDQKLHEKFFPNLSRDIEKLKWMQQTAETETISTIDNVSDCRFDFNGDLVPPTREIESTTTSALHHHSQDPQLAGYTIVELDHLARSTFPSQRCISIQTMGRILYKLGKQSYYQLVPEIDAETYQEDGNIENVMNKIYSMFWDMVKDLNIIEWLEFTSIEKNTPNLSVRNYAIDALWLWKQGGGDFRNKNSK